MPILAHAMDPVLGHGTHEWMTWGLGLFVWATAPLFIGTMVLIRRGAFEGRATVPFAVWASVIAAGLSGAAAAIHFAAAADHFSDVVDGLGFMAVAWFQAVWPAASLVVRARWLTLLGLLVNLGVIAVWAASRTVGLPIGPAPWIPEATGLLDLLATGFEIGLVVLLAIVLVRGRERTEPSLHLPNASLYIGSLLIGLVLLTSLALAQVGVGGVTDHDPDAHPVEQAGQEVTGSSPPPDPSETPPAAPTPPSPPPTDPPKATPGPTAPRSTPVAPSPSTGAGSIAFGTSLTNTGALLGAATRFEVGEATVWVVELKEPLSIGARFVIHSILADGREFEHWNQRIDRVDQDTDSLVGMGVLSDYAHGGPGRYRMRYVRDDLVLAEADFELYRTP